MTIKLGVVMDPIQEIRYKKDSTLAMLWEAQARGWTIYYFEQSNVFIREGKAFGNSRSATVFHDPQHWFELGEPHCIELAELDVILMRKDPPFDLNYIYTTYILELAEKTGTLICNKPQSLRDINEKFYTAWFPEQCPPTLVTRDITLLRQFLHEQKDIICKPLNAMGGASIFRVQEADRNASVIFETLTHQGSTFMLAQQFVPAIFQGDKRILLIDGEPVPYALNRIPATGELRGNLAAGAKGIAQPLTKNDIALCKAVGPTLREKGILFAGLDVIGNYITEINVTSPTCIRELDEQCHLNISKLILDAIELKI